MKYGSMVLLASIIGIDLDNCPTNPYNQKLGFRNPILQLCVRNAFSPFYVVALLRASIASTSSFMTLQTYSRHILWPTNPLQIGAF